SDPEAGNAALAGVLLLPHHPDPRDAGGKLRPAPRLPRCARRGERHARRQQYGRHLPGRLARVPDRVHRPQRSPHRGAVGKLQFLLMQISVRHELVVPIASGGRTVAHVLLTPLSGPGQTVLGWSIEMPGIETASRFTDAFGNRALLISQPRAE